MVVTERVNVMIRRDVGFKHVMTGNGSDYLCAKMVFCYIL